MKTIAFVGTAREVGNTMLAAHTCFLAAARGHRVVGISLGPDKGLRRWLEAGGISWQHEARSWSLDAELAVVDSSAEAALEGPRPDVWVLPINGGASLDRAAQYSPHLPGRVLCVWSQARRDELFELFPSPHGPLSPFVSAEIPKCSAIREACARHSSVWSLPHGTESPGARALHRVIQEVLEAISLDPYTP